MKKCIFLGTRLEALKIVGSYFKIDLIVTTKKSFIDKYFKKNRDGKQILRDVMKNYIPDDVVKAPKQGFSAPDASWFREDSLNFVKEKLYNSDAKIYENLDKSSVQALVNEHLHGKVNRRLLIWSLLNIEEWMQTFH